MTTTETGSWMDMLVQALTEALGINLTQIDPEDHRTDKGFILTPVTGNSLDVVIQAVQSAPGPAMQQVRIHSYAMRGAIVRDGVLSPLEQSGAISMPKGNPRVPDAQSAAGRYWVRVTRTITVDDVIAVQKALNPSVVESSSEVDLLDAKIPPRKQRATMVFAVLEAMLSTGKTPKRETKKSRGTEGYWLVDNGAQHVISVQGVNKHQGEALASMDRMVGEVLEAIRAQPMLAAMLADRLLQIMRPTAQLTTKPDGKGRYSPRVTITVKVWTRKGSERFPPDLQVVPDPQRAERTA